MHTKRKDIFHLACTTFISSQFFCAGAENVRTLVYTFQELAFLSDQRALACKSNSEVEVQWQKNEEAVEPGLKVTPILLNPRVLTLAIAPVLI